MPQVERHPNDAPIVAKLVAPVARRRCRNTTDFALPAARIRSANSRSKATLG